MRFFFNQKICLEQFENKFSGSLHFLYELSMISSQWKGERAGYKTLHSVNSVFLVYGK